MTMTYPNMGLPAHNPFDGGQMRRPRWVYPAVAVSLLIHGVFFLCLLTARFTPTLIQYSDQATDVTLMRAVPPPPPPEPPKAQPVRQEAPPVVQPRQAAAAPVGVAAPPPLNIAPVDKPAPIAAPPVAIAPPAPPHTPVITDPVWSRLPDGDDIARYYPERAQRLGVTGRATMHCHVTASGAVAQCSILAESPPEQEFGAAALKMTRLFAMKPQTRDGQPVDGAVVNIIVHFTLPPVS